MTFELLEGGMNAFPEIIRQIRAADHEITVHMFIWREDRIGTEIAGEIIDGAERELCIMMAYFVPDKDILSAIRRALHRAVRVRILIPRSANYMDDMNKLAALKLLRYSGSRGSGYSGSLEIFMTEKMLHSKLLMNEKRIIIGSCNINKKSFTKLDELAVIVDNDDSPFAEEIRISLREAFQDAECVRAPGMIRCNPLLAALETAVM